MKGEYNFKNAEQDKFYYLLKELETPVYFRKRQHNRFVVNTYISFDFKLTICL